MAEDRYERYYAEKFWELIPTIYRHEDGLATPPGVLRSIVEAMATQAAVLRRSTDRLWEDQSVEHSDEWAVPYIGDLLATRLVSALNRRGRRIDVAKTIYYRRRKGTPRALEELISDIAGWEGVVAEGFMTLGRAVHRLDPLPSRRLRSADRFSSTPRHGLADLRRPAAAERVGRAFDEYAHTPSVRRYRGRDGRHGITRLSFHLYRVPAVKLDDAAPRDVLGGTRFTFDPSGRDAPLMIPRRRTQNLASTLGPDWDHWTRALEWQVPAPMPCRILGHAEYLLAEDVVRHMIDDHGLAGAAVTDLRSLNGRAFESESKLRFELSRLPNGATLLATGNYRAIAARALVEHCGKRALMPDAVSIAGIEPEAQSAGSLEAWRAIPGHLDVVIDPERGRFQLSSAAATHPSVSYYYGFPAQIGAGAYDRPSVDGISVDRTIANLAITATDVGSSGTAQIPDNRAYTTDATITGITNLRWQAAAGRRPYVELVGDLTFQAAGTGDAELELDGLWLGAQNPHVVRLSGDYERVSFRSLTLDPGGPLTADPGSADLPGVTLVVEGHIELLEIDASVLGPVAVPGVVEELRVRDSVIQSPDAAVQAFDQTAGETRLERVSILGNLAIHRLWADATLIAGAAIVTDRQAGCFRFSAAEATSELPGRYESHVVSSSAGLFVSRRFGNPRYAQLREGAPEEIRTGAENGSEIGAYSALLDPIRRSSLLSKIEEYAPFGLLPGLVIET